MVRCGKDTGACARVGGPTYVGVVSDKRPVRERAREHFGSTIWPSHRDTDKPVGVHFRGPGHVPQRDLSFLPIEKVRSKDPFVRLARESFWISSLGTLRKHDDDNVQFGLNIDP